MTTTHRRHRGTLIAAAPLAAAALFLAGCGMNTPAETITPTAPPSEGQTQGQTPSGQDRSDDDDKPAMAESGNQPGTSEGAGPTLEVGILEASRIAEGAHDDGRVVSIDLDRAGGVTVWDVEIVTPTAQFDLDIDATTGEILKNQEERDSDDLLEDNQNLDAATISFAQAVEAALKEHDGGTVLEVGLDEDDGQIVWEIEIMTTDRAAYDLKIDAVSGEILLNRLDD